MTLGTHIFVSLHLNNLLKRHIPKYDEQDIQDCLYADGLELRRKCTTDLGLAGLHRLRPEEQHTDSEKQD